MLTSMKITQSRNIASNIEGEGKGGEKKGGGTDR
jgi:hypothetical protein